MSNFTQVIERYRQQSASEREKGTRFERLIRAYFLSEPKYQTTIKTVWMWSEFPYRADFGGNDIGRRTTEKQLDRIKEFIAHAQSS